MCSFPIKFLKQMQMLHFVSWLEQQLSKLLSLCSPESFSVFFEWKTFQYSIAFDFAPSNGWSLYEESEHDTIYHTSVNNRHTKATHWIFTATNNRGKYFLKRNSHLFLKPCTVHGMFLEWWNRTKVFPTFFTCTWWGGSKNIKEIESSWWFF